MVVSGKACFSVFVVIADLGPQVLVGRYSSMAVTVGQQRMSEDVSGRDLKVTSGGRRLCRKYLLVFIIFVFEQNNA